MRNIAVISVYVQLLPASPLQLNSFHKATSAARRVKSVKPREGGCSSPDEEWNQPSTVSLFSNKLQFKGLIFPDVMFCIKTVMASVFVKLQTIKISQ